MEHAAKLLAAYAGITLMTSCGDVEQSTTLAPQKPGELTHYAASGAHRAVQYPPSPIFVADYGNKLVKEIPAGCMSASCVKTVGTGFSFPTYLAVDLLGDRYVSNTGNHHTGVYEMPAGCKHKGCAAVVGGGFHNPFGLALDPTSGNLYVADYSHHVVKAVPRGCTDASCVTTIDVSFRGRHGEGPSSVALDSNGNLYVAWSRVTELPPGCNSDSCAISLGGGFLNPIGASVDGSGNVYVADNGANEIKAMPPDCFSVSCVSTIGGGFNSPYTVTADAVGNVYVGDQGNDAVKEIPAGCLSASCTVTIGGGFSSPTGTALSP